jgi:Alpha-tubulin suppressor and related RCC1 domain-containing proteins
LGRKQRGQIGRGTWSTTDASPIPTPVKSNLQFKTISTYTAHPCAVAMSGAAYCWGGNTVFQTGQATPEVCYSQHPCVTAPGRVSGGLTFDMVVSSDFGACGLAPDGGAHCWGMDTQSMLGATSVPVCPVEGATNCTSTPLPGPVGFKTITGGSRNYCGLRFDGGAYCWGGNRSGQLGVASTDQTAIPLVFTIDPGVTPP